MDKGRREEILEFFKEKMSDLCADAKLFGDEKILLLRVGMLMDRESFHGIDAKREIALIIDNQVATYFVKFCSSGFQNEIKNYAPN